MPYKSKISFSLNLLLILTGGSFLIVTAAFSSGLSFRGGLNRSLDAAGQFASAPDTEDANKDDTADQTSKDGGLSVVEGIEGFKDLEELLLNELHGRQFTGEFFRRRLLVSTVDKSFPTFNSSGTLIFEDSVALNEVDSGISSNAESLTKSRVFSTVNLSDIDFALDLCSVFSKSGLCSLAVSAPGGEEHNQPLLISIILVDVVGEVCFGEVNNGFVVVLGLNVGRKSQKGKDSDDSEL
mmetsp:Transcript_15083/g.12797  ORF Transcript_15083/g.12797 Transcript_15083/m.12797 type:complete len:239 (-) Transcript_15083:62-778(-)